MKLFKIGLGVCLIVALFLSASPVYADDPPDKDSDTVVGVKVDGDLKASVNVTGPAELNVEARGPSKVDINTDNQVNLSVDADETSKVFIEHPKSSEGHNLNEPAALQKTEAEYHNPSSYLENHASNSYRNIPEFERLFIITSIAITIVGLVAFFTIRYFTKNIQVRKSKGEIKEVK